MRAKTKERTPLEREAENLIADGYSVITLSTQYWLTWARQTYHLERLSNYARLSSVSPQTALSVMTCYPVAVAEFIGA